MKTVSLVGENRLIWTFFTKDLTGLAYNTDKEEVTLQRANFIQAVSPLAFPCTPEAYTKLIEFISDAFPGKTHFFHDKKDVSLSVE